MKLLMLQTSGVGDFLTRKPSVLQIAEMCARVALLNSYRRKILSLIGFPFMNIFGPHNMFQLLP